MSNQGEEEHFLSSVVLQYGRLLGDDTASLNVAALVDDFKNLMPIITADPVGWGLLSRGGLSVRIQKSVVEKLLDKIAADLPTRQLIFLMIRNRRLEELPQFIEFCFKYLKEKGCEIASLITAKNVDPQEIKKIQDTLNESGLKKTILRTEIDQTLLGGAILFWRGMMVDGSTRTLLDHLRV